MRDEPHLTYHAVCEALRDTATCALCELEQKTVHRYLSGLLYEQVNDPGLREALRHSRGLCAPHAHRLLTFHDGLGTTLLYQDQVKLFLDYLSNLPRRGWLGRGRNRSGWHRHEPCPACSVQEGARERYVNTLAPGLSDAALRAALEASPGLCVEHSLLVLDQIRGPTERRYFVEARQQQFTALLGELEEYARKNDYRMRDEPLGKERDVWMRAVQMMQGLRDVFGAAHAGARR